MDNLTLRKVNEEDCRFLFDLANDPTVRATAINPQPIPWENHVGWFNKKLSSEGTYMFILEREGRPLGQARYELKDGTWDIGYSILHEERGKGYGKIVIEKSLQAMPRVPITAVVKPDNVASVKVFRALSFLDMGTVEINGGTYLKFGYNI